jgi:hypothetical protein
MGAGREAAYSLAVGVAAAAIAWLRLDGRTRGVVWAEDGMFLRDRLDQGPLVTLVDPYQGYLHLLPRVLVEGAVLLPLRDYAVAVTGLCCLVAGLVAALVHTCSRDVIGTRAARVALGLVTVLVPTAAAEVLGNGANLHWFLLWLTPWVLLCRPRTWSQGWALGAVLLVVALTEIQAALFLPLLLLGLRDRRRWPMVAGLLLGLSAQVVVASTTARTPDDGTPSLLDLAQGYGLHVFLQMWRPATAGVGDVLVERGWSLVVLAAVPFLVALVALVAGTRGKDEAVLTATLLAGAVVPFLAGVALNFRSFLAFDGFGLETLAVFAPLRYAVVPSMFVLASVVVVGDRLARRPGRGGDLAAGGLLVLLLGLGLVHLDAGPTNRSESPGWSSGVDRAEERCRAGAEAVEVPTAPETWAVRLDCAEVEAAAGRR